MKSAQGTIDSIYAIRLEPGEDVMRGIMDACETYDINSGVILSAIGSLNGASFFDPEELPGKKGLYGYGAAIELPAPVELISLSGIVCTGEAGDRQLHLHCCLADGKGAAYAGHFKEGNAVLNTVEMVIGKIGGIDMIRRVDPLRKTPYFSPEKKEEKA